MKENYKEILRNKRLAALDYGRKRIGFAVCDELHVVVSTRGVFYREKPDLYNVIRETLIKENIGGIIVGIPERLDNIETSLIKEIKKFIESLEELTELPVISYDESFSSRRATDTMVEIGMKKKKRSKKGSADEVAAAIILRDFLGELED